MKIITSFDDSTGVNVPFWAKLDMLDVCWEKYVFIWLLPGKSVIRSVAVRHRLLARTYSESERCSASCSVVSLFAARYLARLHVTL